MDFEITTQYTLEEYKQFNRTLLSKVSKLRPVLIVGALIIAGEDLFCLVWGGLNLFLFVLPITLLCVAALFLIHWLGGRSAVKIWESKYLTKDATLTFHFTADRVEIIFGDSKEIYPYENLWRLVETDTHFYPLVSARLGFIIRKDACTQEQQDFIREKCAGQRGKRKTGQPVPEKITLPKGVTEQNTSVMEEPLFVAATKYTLREYLTFHLVFLTRSWSIYCMLGVIMILLALIYVPGEGIEGLRHALLLFAIIFVGVIALRLFVSIFSWMTNKQLKNCVGKYRFYPDRVDIFGSWGKTGVPYDKFYKIIETGKHFYLMIARNQGYILCKSACSSELIEFLKGKKYIDN